MSSITFLYINRPITKINAFYFKSCRQLKVDFGTLLLAFIIAMYLPMHIFSYGFELLYSILSLQLEGLSLAFLAGQVEW